MIMKEKNNAAHTHTHTHKWYDIICSLAYLHCSSLDRNSSWHTHNNSIIQINFQTALWNTYIAYTVHQLLSVWNYLRIDVSRGCADTFYRPAAGQSGSLDSNTFTAKLAADHPSLLHYSEIATAVMWTHLWVWSIICSMFRFTRVRSV